MIWDENKNICQNSSILIDPTKLFRNGNNRRIHSYLIITLLFVIVLHSMISIVANPEIVSNTNSFIEKLLINLIGDLIAIAAYTLIYRIAFKFFVKNCSSVDLKNIILSFLIVFFLLESIFLGILYFIKLTFIIFYFFQIGVFFYLSFILFIIIFCKLKQHLIRSISIAVICNIFILFDAFFNIFL